jgi:hypothetical protein
MRLSARFLNDVTSVNSFEFAETSEFTLGDPADVYFQLIDSTLDKSINGFFPTGRRYIPVSGATLQCVAENIDITRKITRYATNPFADDRSIWKLSFLASDLLEGTCNLKLTLTEGSVVRTGIVVDGLRIQNVNNLTFTGFTAPP